LHTKASCFEGEMGIMTFRKLLGALVLCSVVALVVMGEEKETLLATTKDGRQVILYIDGTWEWFSSREETLATWKEPTLEQCQIASEWGAVLDEPPSSLWTVCEDGPCSDLHDPWSAPNLFVGTPLAIIAREAYASQGLDENQIYELREECAKELRFYVNFTGHPLDGAAPFEIVIKQGDLVLRPYRSFMDHEPYTPTFSIFSISGAFVVSDLDPTRPFWLHASQPMGERRFSFKVDPSVLGSGEFF